MGVSFSSGVSTHCNTLQHTATHCNTRRLTATHCNTLQLTATHCDSLQHTATHCHTLQHTATHCNTLPLTATHCNTLPLIATHCNSLQPTASCACNMTRDMCGHTRVCIYYTCTVCVHILHMGTHTYITHGHTCVYIYITHALCVYTYITHALCVYIYTNTHQQAYFKPYAGLFSWKVICMMKRGSIHHEFTSFHDM